jgi:hypothetical protein
MQFIQQYTQGEKLNNSLKFFFSIILSSACLASFGQTKNKPSKPKDNQEKKLEESYSSSIFSPIFYQHDTPAQEYLANSPEKVYQWIEEKMSSIPNKPDQFSSTEERQAYKEKLDQQMLQIELIPFFVDCNITYNASRQFFEISKQILPIDRFDIKDVNPEDLNLRILKLGSRKTKSSTYIAENAYGAAVEVSKSSWNEFNFLFQMNSDNAPTSAINKGSFSRYINDYYNSYPSFQMTINMSSTDAREKSKNLACLYVVHLTDPYAIDFQQRIYPKIDSPYDQVRYNYSLYGKIDKFIAVDKTTGHVYGQADRVNFMK